MNENLPGRQRLTPRCSKTRPCQRASALVKVAAISGNRRRCQLQRFTARELGAFSFLPRRLLAKVPLPHVPPGYAGPPVVPNAASRGCCGAPEEGEERDWPLSLAGNVNLEASGERLLLVGRRRAAVVASQRPFLFLAAPLKLLTALEKRQRGLFWGGKGGREVWLFSSLWKGKFQREPFPLNLLRQARPSQDIAPILVLKVQPGVLSCWQARV